MGILKILYKIQIEDQKLLKIIENKFIIKDKNYLNIK